MLYLLAQTNEAAHVVRIDQDPTNAEPLHLLHATQTSVSLPTTTAVTQLKYDALEILTPPKKKWHYRNMKDLGKGGAPLLAGDGPQRTPIQVKVKHCLYSIKNRNRKINFYSF